MLSTLPSDILNYHIFPELSRQDIGRLYVTSRDMKHRTEKRMQEERESYPNNQEIVKFWSQQKNPHPLVLMFKHEIVYGRKYATYYVCQALTRGEDGQLYNSDWTRYDAWNDINIDIAQPQFYDNTIDYWLEGHRIRIPGSERPEDGWIDPFTLRDILLSRAGCNKERVSEVVRKYLTERLSRFNWISYEDDEERIHETEKFLKSKFVISPEDDVSRQYMTSDFLFAMWASRTYSVEYIQTGLRWSEYERLPTVEDKNEINHALRQAYHDL